MTELKTAWAFGPYSSGMGAEGDHPRMRYAVEAIKKELVFLGFTDIELTHTRFGGAVRGAVKEVQRANGLEADGLVGPKTANALWRSRIEQLQEEHNIPRDWMRALVHWESLDDPGAQYPNPDGTNDNGLCMLNSTRKPLTEDEAFDPQRALSYAANYLHELRDRFQGGVCAVDAPPPAVLAVASWRTPVGASDWCNLGVVEPSTEGSWAQLAAHYVERVDTVGRMGWVG